MVCGIRAFLRLITFAVLMTLLSIFVPLTRLLSGEKNAFNIYRNGMFLMHKILGIRLNIIGEFPKEPAIIMFNHPSYFDIFYNIGKRPAVMVVGHQFKKWPFIGWLAMALKSIFVNRTNPNARKKVRENVIQTIKKGLSVFVSPEGRTSGSHCIHEVKPGLFHDASTNNIPIVFYSFWYHSTDFPYFHDLKSGFLLHLFKHLWRALKNKYVKVDMRISSPRKIDSAETGMQDFYRFNAWHLRNAIDKERIENPNILV